MGENKKNKKYVMSSGEVSVVSAKVAQHLLPQVAGGAVLFYSIAGGDVAMCVCMTELPIHTYLSDVSGERTAAGNEGCATSTPLLACLLWALESHLGTLVLDTSSWYNTGPIESKYLCCCDSTLVVMRGSAHRVGIGTRVSSRVSTDLAWLLNE